MKNKTIIKLLCISLTMIILGGIITLAATMYGGKLSISQARVGIFNYIKWGDSSHLQDQSNSYTSKEEVLEFQVDIDCASIEIKKGSVFNISTESINSDDISIKEENGVYLFKLRQKDINIIGNNDGGEIYVTLPESVKTIDIDQSLGEVEISDMDLTTLTINSDMGDIDLAGITFEEGDISLSLGSFDFYGDFTKKFKLVNHMGDADIQLMKNANEYNYALKVNMGEIIINDQQHGNMNTSFNQNNDKEVTIEAKLDMGSLKLRNE